LGELRLLPEATQRLLRAGETIDQVAAVVRELVDNALDAGADEVTVQYWPERWQVQVSDNGRGLVTADLRVCAERHTTSKLYAIEELYQIASLGFRGEALFAIAAVSTLTIASRTAGGEGQQASYDPTGTLLKLEPIGLGAGTVVTVRELFGCLPVRQQFLNLKKETQQVAQVLRRIALAQPGVTLRLIINDRPRLHLLGVSNPRRRLGQVLGIAEGDLRLVVQDHLRLVVGLPDRISRPRSDAMFIGVNGRLVEDTDLLGVLHQSFQRTLPKGRHPVVLALWDLPASWVDWHRHPAKQTVHLGERPQLEAWLSQAVTEGLSGLALRPQPGLFNVAEARTLYQTGSPLNPLKALSQVQNTYVLAEHQAGLWLVEQHVCHERVIFEQLSTPWQVVPCPPQVLPLSARQVEHLTQLGLEVEAFGEGLWCVRSLPQLLAQHPDPRASLRLLSLAGDLEQARVTLACRSAVKNGTPLTLDWLQHLLDQWQQTSNPHTCPHGRPIYLTLSNDDLGHYFRRNWRVCDNLSDRLE